MDNNKTEHGSMVSIASSTTTTSNSTSAAMTNHLQPNNNAYSPTNNLAPPPLPSKPALSLSSPSEISPWQTLSDTAPRVIGETARFIVEHYSQTEPYRKPPSTPIAKVNISHYHLEHCDHDREDPYVYRSFFYGREHKNLLGFHPDLGSICISVRKEVEKSKGEKRNSHSQYLYRGILRTSEKFTYVVKTETELNLTPKQKLISKISTKDVIFSIFSDCESAKLKEIDDPKLSFELLTMEEKLIQNNYKFGIVYCKAGQSREDEMLSNETGSDNFTKFLNCIGERVKLKGFKGYRGGLDVKEDTTGSDSYVASFRDMRVMYHVSTLLPYSESNKQQIQRKAQIGETVNPFDPTIMVSQFPHVFVVVEQVQCADGVDRFRVATARREDVPGFGPYPQSRGLFELDSNFRDFILAKLINGENAAYQATKFSQLRTRTRKGLLEDLTSHYLRKASLGSTSSLSTWKSLFGTADNLSLRASASKDGLNSTDSNRLKGFSFLGTKTDDESLHRSKSYVASHASVRSKVVSTRRTSTPSQSETLSLQPSSQPFESLPISPTESYRILSKESSISPSPIVDELTLLREENSILKKKLETRAMEHVAALEAQQSELTLKIELHETKIKLLKALAFIESLSSDGSLVMKELKNVPN